MKRFIAFVISVSFVLTLCGCAHKKTERNENDDKRIIIVYPNDHDKQTAGGYKKPSEENCGYYVLNKSGHTFHRPDCPYVLKANETGLELGYDYENIINNGYKPCSYCNPE